MNLQIIAAEAYGLVLSHDYLSGFAKAAGEESAKIGFTNLKRVAKDFQSKLRKRGKKGGAVPVRVGKEAFLQAYYCEDELQGSYLGGILASSTSKISRDDRAVTYLAILNSLSSYQIRTHAILYSSLLRIGEPAFTRGRRDILRGSATIILPEKSYRAAMNFTKHESPDVISQHIFTGLEQHGLLQTRNAVITPRKELRFSGPLMFPAQDTPIDEPYRYFHPTALGIELFLWGVGYGDKGMARYTPDLLKRIKMPVKVTPSHVIWGQVTLG